MKETFLFVVIAAWIALCGCGVEKAGNLIPDRAMRLLAKFLLFVLFAFAPLLTMVERDAGARSVRKWSKQNVQRGTAPICDPTASCKDLQ